MNLKLKCAGAAALALMAGAPASAAIISSASETGVFISVVERDDINNITGNLVIDLGFGADAFFNDVTADGIAMWTTTASQSAAIKTFLDSATGSVSLNVGAAELVTNSEDWGFVSTGVVTGPGLTDFLAFNSGVQNTLQFVSNANQGDLFDADGLLAASLSADPGFHGNPAWGNNIGGAVNGNNELTFGTTGSLTRWSLDVAAQGFVEGLLGQISSDMETGQVSFSTATTVVPVPAAAWLFGSALGLLGWVRRRSTAK